MFEKLKATEEKFEDISNRLTDPEVIGDNGLYAKLMKEYKSLSPIVEKYREYCSYVKTEQEAQEMLDESGADRELKDLARAELDEARENIASVSEELKILLIPKDPNDDRNVIVEIRGGAGGDEASLFANSLFRMYPLNLCSCQVRNKKKLIFFINGEPLARFPMLLLYNFVFSLLLLIIPSSSLKVIKVPSDFNMLIIIHQHIINEISDYFFIKLIQLTKLC